jgi:class 3 adenylate cyclase/tetratricopeptide (TPR) repeat protein
VTACAVCRAENPDGFRFCGNCGSPLADAAAPQREARKVVTVLFCDVTGSTPLGERLDPESLRAVMGRYFATVQAALERHGGTVEKFIGDAVMAVFGIPELHEDDALRAVRAACDARDALAALNDELEATWGVRIETRTGVNTGEVVAGDPTAGQRLVTGDAVNVAARLEQAARQGEILVGASTYALVRDGIDAEAVEPLELKGKSEPMAAWQLRGVHADATAVVRRLDAPLIGRDRELLQLQQAYERAVHDHTCHLVTVLGSAGIGKSRLVAELSSRMSDQARVLVGRCLPYGDGITFWPLIEMLRTLEQERPLEELLSETPEGESVAAKLRAVTGSDDLVGGPEETFWAVRKLLETLATERPVVAVFDDFENAEPTLLGLVEHIADWSRETPILLLCLARPELLDRAPTWGGGKLNAASILLEPLSAEESDALIERVGGRAIDEPTRRRVATAADGNPLFMEQMLALAGEQSDGELRIPPTIQALLAARIDRLPSAERAVIECASVIGHEFWRSAVAELSPAEVQPGVGGHLMTLVRKELVRQALAALAGDDAFRFRHLLVRDAAYDAIPKQLRAELHERFAEWLQERASLPVERDEIAGYHFAEAYAYRSELGPVGERERALGRRGAEHLSVAARRAGARGDASATERLLTRAAGLVPPNDDLRLQLLWELSMPLFEIGAFDRMAEIERELRASGETRYQVYGDLIRHYASLNVDPNFNLVELRAGADAVITRLRELDDHAGLSRAYFLRAVPPWNELQAEEAQAYIRKGIDEARLAGSRAFERDALSWLVPTFPLGPMPVDEGLAQLEQLRPEVAGLLHAEASLERGAARLLAMRGDFEQARTLNAKSRATLTELGQHVLAAGYVLGDGFVEMQAGDLEAAVGYLRTGDEALAQVGERGFRSTVVADLAVALARLGDGDAALRYADLSAELAPDRDLASHSGWRSARALVLAQRGEFAEAERLAREAVELLADSDFLGEKALKQQILGEVLAAAGRREAAEAAFAAAIAFSEQKGDVVSVARVRRLRDELAAQT